MINILKNIIKNIINNIYIKKNNIIMISKICKNKLSKEIKNIYSRKCKSGGRKSRQSSKRSSRRSSIRSSKRSSRRSLKRNSKRNSKKSNRHMRRNSKKNNKLRISGGGPYDSEPESTSRSRKPRTARNRGGEKQIPLMPMPSSDRWGQRLTSDAYFDRQSVTASERVVTVPPLRFDRMDRRQEYLAQQQQQEDRRLIQEQQELKKKQEDQKNKLQQQREYLKTQQKQRQSIFDKQLANDDDDMLSKSKILQDRKIEVRQRMANKQRKPSTTDLVFRPTDEQIENEKTNMKKQHDTTVLFNHEFNDLLSDFDLKVPVEHQYVDDSDSEASDNGQDFDDDAIINKVVENLSRNDVKSYTKETFGLLYNAINELYYVHINVFKRFEPWSVIRDTDAKRIFLLNKHYLFMDTIVYRNPRKKKKEKEQSKKHKTPSKYKSNKHHKKKKKNQTPRPRRPTIQHSSDDRHRTPFYHDNGYIIGGAPAIKYDGIFIYIISLYAFTVAIVNIIEYASLLENYDKSNIDPPDDPSVLAYIMSGQNAYRGDSNMSDHITRAFNNKNISILSSIEAMFDDRLTLQKIESEFEILILILKLNMIIYMNIAFFNVHEQIGIDSPDMNINILMWNRGLMQKSGDKDEAKKLMADKNATALIEIIKLIIRLNKELFEKYNIHQLQL